MRVRIENHLVARRQPQAGGDDGVALGGGAHERHFVALHAEKLRDDCTGVRQALVTVLGFFLELPRDLGHFREHGARGGAESTGVEIRESRLKRKLRTDRPPERLRIALVKPRQRRGRIRAAQRGPRQQANRAGAQPAEKCFAVEVHVLATTTR